MISLSENKFTWVYVITVFLLLIFTFFSDRGLIRVHHLTKERNNLRWEAGQIEKNNRMLLTESVALRSDLSEMEKTARAELDLVREDEILYKFTK